MDPGLIGSELNPVHWEEHSPEFSCSDMDSPSPPRKRARLRGLVSHVRSGQKVHPDSAYVGTLAHDLAMTAKPESEILSKFLVPPL